MWFVSIMKFEATKTMKKRRIDILTVQNKAYIYSSIKRIYKKSIFNFNFKCKSTLQS